MRVVQINTVFGDGSTGRTTKELHNYLMSKKHESFVFYGTGKKSNDANVILTQNRFSYLVNNFFGRLLGAEGFLAASSTKKIIKHVRKIKPDVVHLRNLHGSYINIPKLFNFLAKENVKVVMSLHDLWMLTGKCPSPYLHSCEKWKTGCNHCPAKKDYPISWFFDNSKKQFKHKKRSLASLKNNIYIMGVSNWTKTMADSYPLPLQTGFIYNWIDTELFKPKEQNDTENNSINVLFASAIWEQKSEKFNDLLQLREILPQNYKFYIVGHTTFDKTQYSNNTNMIFLPKLNPEELVNYYSKCDIYAHLSHSDTFGKIIAEALSCGTPVVGYDVTAIPELIAEGCGAKVEPFNINDFANKIVLLGKKTPETIKRCRKSVLNRFSYQNLSILLNFYEEIIK